jgi:hypothetical protein
MIAIKHGYLKNNITTNVNKTSVYMTYLETYTLYYLNVKEKR